jgi:hypothetical protein
LPAAKSCADKGLTGEDAFSNQLLEIVHAAKYIICVNSNKKAAGTPPDIPS